jgi:ubiquinol-cytochrome c reductase cytochrome b subunit
MAIDHEVETTGLVGWIDRRFPMTATWKKHVSEYYAPKKYQKLKFFGA